MKIVKDKIQQVISEMQTDIGEFVIEHPADSSHGDWSTNVAMVMAKGEGRNPRELAGEIVGKLKDDARLMGVFEDIEVAGPGFINFRYKREYLENLLNEIYDNDDYGKGQAYAGKRVVVEYTDPNPFKEFHIGHLMSNAIGESMARVFIWNGATVKKVNYQGDVGVHVAKSVWGMMKLTEEQGVSLEELSKKSLDERQKFMGSAYAYGAKHYQDPRVEEEIKGINKKIYEKSDPEINKIYEIGREWSLEYFEKIYERLGTKFDDYYFESETGAIGLEVVSEGEENGVFSQSDGATIYEGEKYGLHTRVFKNSLGLPTYEAKDLGLAKAKWDRWEYDLSYIITANEIDEYFKVVLSAMSKLYPELASKTLHKSHGMMKLPSGKMSSRTGDVVTGEELLDSLKEAVLKLMEGREISNIDEIADDIAVGALKYAVLKQSIGNDIIYDKDKLVSFEGNTGPYLQYTYARARSVISKSGSTLKEDVSLGEQEIDIVRLMSRFPEIVEDAGQSYSPHLICVYLYELAQKYNSFYNKEKIIGSENEASRLMLTEGMARIIENGLSILGISAPEKM